MFSLRVIKAASWFALACGLAVMLPVSPEPVSAQLNVPNTITIREKAGVTTTNYPIQIARLFVQGEIKHAPRAVINGTPLPTQADIKARWEDGTVKHAVMSFLLPTLAANSEVTVSFINQPEGTNAGALTKNDMLAAGQNFNARIELTNNAIVVSADARDMLNADKFTYWNAGAIATSVILADHSVGRSFDIGFDAHRSFRPIFHATFWPQVNKIKVRFIGEIANTVALQDQTYALSLKLQHLNPTNVYSKAAFTHPAATRWTKEFWIGGAPPKIDINHNLDYLRQTNAVPNFDTSRKVSQAAMQYAYADAPDSWLNSSRDIFDSGNLYKLMPTAGGRDEIGPYPTWVTRWLYMGDARMFEQSVGNAELSAAFPIHFREGLDGRPFDRPDLSGVTTPALGKILSASARPTVFLHRGNAYIDYLYTEAQDKIVPLNGTSFNDDEWLPDCAHQPDYHSALYTLTGDYFFLEEMNFWASWSAVSANYTNAYWWGRGPTGDTGGIIDEVRGDGWILRNRAQAAFLNPDGSAEKTYFKRLTNDAIAIWEGTLGLAGTPNAGTPNYVWGATVARKKFAGDVGRTNLPPLGFWEEGHAVGSWSEIVDYNKAKIEASPWMHYILVYGLGRAKELGFPTQKLLTYAARVGNQSVTDFRYSPYLATAYQMPTVKRTTDAFFSTWLDEKRSFLRAFDPWPGFQEQLTDGNHGYAFLLMAATAMSRQEINGSSAWTFVQQNIQTSTALENNPKWAILPR